ncbi:unnamed protein product [Thlaspi arvense]|uniref:Uncharacterized protein n=1 Tax=Thlaspi arvense TaxID=13288 RepID=A0AAU9R8S1_THLAR|nr:unnamed protein product [Thlaspi arvense]
MDAAKSETSGSSNCFLPLKKRMRPLDDALDNALAATATKKVAFSGNVKFKGVVQQQNGHWGAQIYTDHKRIWLGTFKSAAEAASAYDSASILLRTVDANSHRNFPLSEYTIHEPEFQARYIKTKVVLNMIRDGSYQHEFRKFLRERFQMVAIINRGDEESNNGSSWTHLFRKKLTPSDVGKLNRLVIPKKDAVKHLPSIIDDQKKREAGETDKEVELVFYDRDMRQWKFRYCYWRSSQSFVFTRGWNGFVKEKKLKENDVIVFYKCKVLLPSNVTTLDDQSNSFIMIDIDFFSDDDSVVPADGKVNKTVYNSCGKELKTENFFNSKLEDEETKSVEKKEGVMLFGVMIQ